MMSLILNMLAQETKNDDRKSMGLLLDVADAWMSLYEKQPDTEMFNTAVSLFEQAEELKHKIETYDYMEDEKRRQRLNKILDMKMDCDHDFKVLPDNTRKCMKCGERRNH